ncbi:MAG TPA: hypothetical protein VKC17_13015 [Sphingomicrobium sp.]|nr:hypothetical protein [Sphingomicrobium sp.]
MHRLFEQLRHAVTGGMTSWYQAKMFVEHASVVNSDGLHVLVGVLAWILVAMVARRSLSARLPWLVLFVLTLLNECVDLWIEQWPDKAMQYGESAKDILLTMTLPTVLMFAVRLRPNLFRASPRRRR